MAIGSPQWMYASGSDFTIPYSCRFNPSDSPYLSRTPSASNRRTWTFSCWFKESSITTNRDLFSAGTSAPYSIISVNYEDTLKVDLKAGVEYSGGGTEALLRDPSAWYHAVVVLDTTNGTADDRFRLYLNGVRVTDWDWQTNPGSSDELTINSNVAHYVGKEHGGSYFDGYMSEVHFIDGTALAPTAFGETGDYGEWEPIEVSGLTYGTNGFYLDFADSAALGNDVSGNNNDFAVTNLAATDQMLDTPTNNFCTMNPLDVQTDDKLQEGNLFANECNRCRGTMAVSSGKWYWEVWLKYQHHSTVDVGIREAGGMGNIDNDTGSNRISISQPVSASGTRWTKWIDGTDTYSSELGTVANDDIWGVALNIDDQEISFTRNGSAIDAEFTDLDYSGLSNMDTVTPFIVVNGGRELVMNFGQDSSFAGGKTAQGNQDSNDIGDFYYTPPTDFLALCTSNLPAVAVVPSEHFNTVLYTGTGTNQVVTGVGFQPDFLWIKNRTAGYEHKLFDVLRGLGDASPGSLSSSATDAEGTFNFINAVSNDGYTTVSSQHAINNTGSGYVAWNWKANGSGSSNTTGTITSTVSANVDAGFSIVSYTGTGSNATVGHGLSVTPEMIIVKNREDAGMPWLVYHADNTSAPETDYLLLNTTAATTDYHTAWNDTAPTSSVFSVGTADGTNQSSDGHIAYCFHSVDGYSKVGSYTGNSSTDGTFVYTGFRPAFLMIKGSSNGGHWAISNNKSTPYNVINKAFISNDSAAEYTDPAFACLIDYTSNGFKWRNSDDNNNFTGRTYIYIAFAETPFKYSNAR